MSLQYGANFLASDMQKLLEQNDRQQSGVRTWKQLFGNASLANQASADTLKGTYADAITQAYKSNLAQRNAILGSGLSAGSTNTMLSANQQNLHNTYQQYMQNLSSDASALAENYGTEVNTLNQALQQRAQNLSDLYSSAYKYLSDRLSTATTSRDLMDKPLYDEDENFTGYEQETLNYLDEYRMDWLRDEAGNLLSWNQVANQLLNPDGSLNARGTEFFDKMFNATPQGYLDEEGERVESFDEWLANENAELRDWAVGQDAFNFNLAGTNIGTAKIHAGLESTDFTGTHRGHLDEEDAMSLTNRLPSVSKDMNDALKNYRWAYDKAKNEYLSAKEPLEQELAQSTAVAAVGEYTELDAAAKKYIGVVNETKSDFYKDLKNMLGSELYNSFVESETVHEKEYNDIVKKIESAKKYDYTIDKFVRELQTWYADYVKRAQDFVRKNRADRKTSGY